MQFDSAYPLVPLKQLVSFINGDRSSNYPTARDYVPDGVPFISATDVGDGRIELGGVKRISRAAFERLRSGHVQRNDVLLCIRGSLGKLGVVSDFDEGAIASSLVILRSAHRIVLQYLRYVLSGAAGVALLGSLDNGSVQGNISVASLKELAIPLPPSRTVEAIASLMAQLDGRIDLLRQTNATVEAIAQALFKSWFVDFDPVRAKAEGREPEGMDAATAALFPAEFEESALGPVPKGWTVQTIGDLVEAVGGSTPDTKNLAFWEPAVHHWTSPKDLSGATAPVLLDTERKVSDAGLAKISSGLLSVGTLLMSSRAPIGYLSLAQVPVAINQGYIAMPPGGQLPPAYLYFWCQLNMDAIKGRANGSTFMEISKKAFRPIPALLPSPEVIDKFNEFATSAFSRVTANERQARAMAQLRDTLLPRLISGKLRLPEAQEQLEGATA